MADLWPTIEPTGVISFSSTPPVSTGYTTTPSMESSYINPSVWSPPPLKPFGKAKKKKSDEAKAEWLKKRLDAKSLKEKDLKEFVSKARERAVEQAVKKIESRRAPPKGMSPQKWLSDPATLQWALKRGMVKMVAKRANPESKDYESVFTLGGKRYALTDLYRAPITERISDVKTLAEVKSSLWWDRNRKTVFVLGAGAVAAYIFYNWYQKNELERKLAMARARSARARGRLAPAGGSSGSSHAGYYSFEPVPRSEFDPPASSYDQYFYHSPSTPFMEYPSSGYSWW